MCLHPTMLAGMCVQAGIGCHVQITTERVFCQPVRSEAMLSGWPQIRMATVWARACTGWNQLSEAISSSRVLDWEKRPAQPSKKLRGRRRSARTCTTGTFGVLHLHTVYKPRRGCEGVSSALGISGHPPGRGAAGAHLAQTQTLACCARPSPLPMSSLAHQGNKVFVAIRSWGSLS